MSPVFLVFAGLGGALITGAVAIFQARRQRSGRVGTSEAKDLWDTMSRELVRLEEVTTSLRAQVTVADQELAALRDSTSQASAKALELDLLLKSCGFEVKRLRTELKALGRDPGPSPEGFAHGS